MFVCAYQIKTEYVYDVACDYSCFVFTGCCTLVYYWGVHVMCREVIAHVCVFCVLFNSIHVHTALTTHMCIY